MKTGKYVALAALCALVLPALGGTKKQVTRPVRASLAATWVVSLLDGSATTEQTGVCSHLGRVRLTGSGVWDLQTNNIASCSGETIAANGDKVFWELTPEGEYQITFTDGTGRFAGVSGGMTTTDQSEPKVTMSEDGKTLTITLSYTAAGTITY